MPITPVQSLNRNPSSGSAPTKTNTTPTIRRRNTEILPSDLHFLNEYLEEEYSNEDEHETSEYFISVTIDEIVCALFAILSIGSGIIYYETRICENECDEFFDNKRLAEKTTLIFSSLSALFFIVSLIPKYYHVFKLMKIARYISIKDTFRESNLWIGLLVELVLAIIHPNLIFKDKYVTTGKGWNILNVDYNWNDFFLVIMIFRLFYVVKIVIISTKYFTARADRVCKMMGMKLDLFFTLKCVMIKNTSIFLIFLTLTVCFGFAYMLKVIEGPVSRITGSTHMNNYTNYGNCFWNIFVTMTTVGYGDYVPKTMLGRLITFLTALSGNILLAMNISFLQSKTQMTSDEEHALDFIERMEERENMQSIAASYFKANFTYFVHKKKFIRSEIPSTKENKDKLVELAKNKFLKRKEFQKILHQFQVKYKMPTDMDKIKNKINSLCETVVNTDKKIELISQKIQLLVKNLQKFGN